MNITPCRTCSFSLDCDLKRAKIKAIRGLRLTSIKFRCDKKLDSLRPGMVVKVNFRYVDSADENGLPNYEWGGAPDDPCKRPETAPKVLRAIVMKWWRNDKVWVFVPNQAGGCLMRTSGTEQQLHMARVTHSVIEPTSETVVVCSHCGMPQQATTEERGEWVCRMEPPHYADYETGYSPCALDCEYPSPAPTTEAGGGA